MRNKKLTANFSLSEFIRPQDPIPSPQILDNLIALANRLQVVRDIIGKSMTITSGYRTKEHNAAVGGEPNSFHMVGMAADIVVEGMSPRELQKLLKNWSGGMGCYSTFTHLDIRPGKARW